MNIYELALAGINVKEGVERFGGNAQLYEKYLRRFSEDSNYAALCEAVDAQDAQKAFAAAHTLKGVAGNLSLTALCRDLAPLVETLRRGGMENIHAQLDAVSKDYDTLLAALEKKS